MDLGRPTTTTEARELVVMVQYYKDMWTRRYHILQPMKEADIIHKGRYSFWNDALEDSFKELEHMASDENLLSYPDWTITFTVCTNYSDKKLGAVIIQNNKPIELFSKILRKLQSNYTTNKKKLLAIFEFLKQSRGIIFGYEINVF